MSSLHSMNMNQRSSRSVWQGLTRGAAAMMVLAGSAVAATEPAAGGAKPTGETPASKAPVYREPGAPVPGVEATSGPVLGTPAAVMSEAPGIDAARERVKAQRAAAAARQKAAKEAQEKGAGEGLLGEAPRRDPMAANHVAGGGSAGVVGVAAAGAIAVTSPRNGGGAKLVMKDSKEAAAASAIDEQRLVMMAKWIDADGSGAIEPAEWRALHPGLGDFDREFEQRYVRANGSLRARALADWDTDGDGEVNDAERQSARKGWERSRLMIVSGFDKDGDAKLDLLELRAFEGSLGGTRMTRAANGATHVAADGQSGAIAPRLSQYRITTTRVATIVSTLDQE